MKKLQKQRLKTLLFTIFLIILSAFSAGLSGKRFIYWDNYILNYERSQHTVMLRNASFVLFISFIFVEILLFYAVVKYRGKLYDKLFRSYRVAGIINRYTVSPDFVQLVLKKRGKYYFPVTNEKGILTKVIPLTENDARDITKLKECTLSNDCLHSFTYGEECYYAFQYEDNELFIDNLNSFREFLNEFEISNSFIQKRINKFLSETVATENE